MIKALIVDDEYLIRKGLVMTLPWAKYDIEIIGEAESVNAASDFVSKNDVDLLLTDITMPDRSGFELISEVKQKHPEIFMAVITCHRDFNLIQNAMRLGAIDYIVKTELDDNELEENIKRISEKVKAQTKSKNTMGLKDFSENENQNCVLLVISRHFKHEINEITGLNCFRDEVPVDLGEGNLLYMIKHENKGKYISCIQNSEISEKWILFDVRNIDKVSKEKFNEFIFNYITNELIYSYTGGTLFETDIFKNENIIQVIEIDKLIMLKKDWSNILWVLNDDEFKRLKVSTVTLKPDIGRLKNIFYKMMEEWEACLSINIPERFKQELEEVKFWVDYDSWMVQFREFVSAKINSSPYQDETVTVILNALEYMKANFTEDINQENISKLFNLSRSYFSKVFKDILGVNYTEYLRNLRLEKAMNLLKQSSKPIYQILNEVGFIDEKYFSRIFREKTGLNPAEYRSSRKDFTQRSFRKN